MIDATIEVPARGNHAWLWKVRLAGYTITCWDTYRFTRAGREILGVKAVKDGKTVYLQDGFCPSPCHSIDGVEAQKAACSFVEHDLQDESLMMAIYDRFGFDD